ncbi:hypothetical protein [Planococcus dechangensis]|uniref:Uncharacterized protein n=1 Tax=Planococcus dechangensis TaxID=1176255 RepID=A0ABV9M8G8_9BACL
MNLEADAQNRKAQDEKKKNRDKADAELLKNAGKDFTFHLVLEGAIRFIFYVLWNVLTFIPKLLFKIFSNTP